MQLNVLSSMICSDTYGGIHLGCNYCKHPRFSCDVVHYKGHLLSACNLISTQSQTDCIPSFDYIESCFNEIAAVFNSSCIPKVAGKNVPPRQIVTRKWDAADKAGAASMEARHVVFALQLCHTARMRQLLGDNGLPPKFRAHQIAHYHYSYLLTATKKTRGELHLPDSSSIPAVVSRGASGAYMASTSFAKTMPSSDTVKAVTSCPMSAIMFLQIRFCPVRLLTRLLLTIAVLACIACYEQ